MNSPVDLLHNAIRDAAPTSAKVTPDHLDLPTPCAGCDLRTLLNHTYSRLDFSARAARKAPVDDSTQLDRLVAFLGRRPSAAASASTSQPVAG